MLRSALLRRRTLTQSGGPTQGRHSTALFAATTCSSERLRTCQLRVTQIHQPPQSGHGPADCSSRVCSGIGLTTLESPITVNLMVVVATVCKAPVTPHPDSSFRACGLAEWPRHAVLRVSLRAYFLSAANRSAAALRTTLSLSSTASLASRRSSTILRTATNRTM